MDDGTFPHHGEVERWLPVVGWEGSYEVSDLGRVRSLDRIASDGKRIRGRMLKPGTHKNGYPVVQLWASNASITRTVHSLIMEAFVGVRPDGMEVRHLDGDAGNSTLGNLAYGTGSENLLDRRRHGTSDRANRTHCPQGHPYDDENTYISHRGNGQEFRGCRICHREACARYNARRARERAAAT